jgi:hypothetical protein
MLARRMATGRTDQGPGVVVVIMIWPRADIAPPPVLIVARVVRAPTWKIGGIT